MEGISHPFREKYPRRASKVRMPSKPDKEVDLEFGDAFKAVTFHLWDKRDERVAKGYRFRPPEQPRDAIAKERPNFTRPPEARKGKATVHAPTRMKYLLGLIKQLQEGPSVAPTEPPPPPVVRLQCRYCGKYLDQDGDFVANRVGFFCTEAHAELGNPFASPPQPFNRQLARRGV